VREYVVNHEMIFFRTSLVIQHKLFICFLNIFSVLHYFVFHAAYHYDVNHEMNIE
jgi:hypothetical protein